MPRGDVFPRRNLPNEAEQWGRAHDNRIVEAEASLDQIEQSVQGLNRSTASSLTSIARQIEAINGAQQALAEQQAEIVAAQAEISQTTNFLSSQTVFDSKSTEVSFSGSNTGTTWLPFDATYDCEVSVTSGAGGGLLVTVSGNVIAGGRTSLLGIQVVGVAGPSAPGPYSTYVTSIDAVNLNGAGVSRSVLTSVTPNTTYTVRSRRGVLGSGAGVNSWDSTGLSVTRY